MRFGPCDLCASTGRAYSAAPVLELHQRHQEHAWFQAEAERAPRLRARRRRREAGGGRGERQRRSHAARGWRKCRAGRGAAAQHRERWQPVGPALVQLRRDGVRVRQQVRGSKCVPRRLHVRDRPGLLLMPQCAATARALQRRTLQGLHVRRQQRGGLRLVGRELHVLSAGARTDGGPDALTDAGLQHRSRT